MKKRPVSYAQAQAARRWKERQIKLDDIARFIGQHEQTNGSILLSKDNFNTVRMMLLSVG